MNGLTYSIAAEYSSLGIRCNAIAHGRIDTPLIQEMLSKTRELTGDDGNDR